MLFPGLPALLEAGSMSTVFLKAIWQWVSKASKMHMPFDSAIPPFQETIQDMHRDIRLFITVFITGNKDGNNLVKQRTLNKLLVCSIP